MEAAVEADDEAAMEMVPTLPSIRVSAAKPSVENAEDVLSFHMGAMVWELETVM